LKKLPEQVIRLAVVFLLFFGTLLAARFFLLPKDLRESGSHRTTAIQREQAKPVHFAGAAACSECHEDITDVLAGGHHRTLSCEVCHGANQAHVDAPDEVTPPAPRGRDFCPVCHAYSQSRPAGFPQILPETHNPRTPCIECHSPHDPVPPDAIHGCDACHPSIARTKAVSPHADVACTTCHEKSKGHKDSPRTVRPQKPVTREFCMRCHGENSGNRAAPKVSMEEHNPKYVCWQCHYPHMPEVH